MEQQLSIENIKRIVALDREYWRKIEVGADPAMERDELMRFVESGEAGVMNYGFTPTLPRHLGRLECPRHWNQLPHVTKCACTEEEKRSLIRKDGVVR